jgi:hypothetical protein
VGNAALWYCSPDNYGRCLLLLEIWWGQRVTVTESAITLLKGLPNMTLLELHEPDPGRRPKAVPSAPPISAPMAEIISRIFQAVSFLEEVRTDLTKQVRQSASRDAAEGAVASALTHLTMGAAMLVPQAFRVPTTAAEAGVTGAGG